LAAADGMRPQRIRTKNHKSGGKIQKQSLAQIRRGLKIVHIDGSDE
jgi:hypothetical protein